MMKFTLLSIEAWRHDCGWQWNSWYTIEDGIFMDESRLTPRKILAALRRWDYLTPESAGKLAVEDDGYNYVIMNKNSGEPLLALDYGSNWEFNEKEQSA